MFVFDLTREHATPFELSMRLTVSNLDPPPPPDPFVVLEFVVPDVSGLGFLDERRSGDAGDGDDELVGDDGVGLERWPTPPPPPTPPPATPPPTRLFNLFASLFTCDVVDVVPPPPPAPFVRPPANEDDDNDEPAGLDLASGDDDDDDVAEADVNMGDMIFQL